MGYLIQDDADVLWVIFQMVVLDAVKFSENLSSAKQGSKKIPVNFSFEMFQE